MVDFGSQDPTYFGLPPKTRIGFEKMQLVRAVDGAPIGRDKFCPRCDRRLAYLEFVAAARELHERRGDPAGTGSDP